MGQGGRRHQSPQAIADGLDLRGRRADHRRIEGHRAGDRPAAGGGRLRVHLGRAHRLRARQGRRRHPRPPRRQGGRPSRDSPTARRKAPPPGKGVDILVNSAGGIPRGTLPRSTRSDGHAWDLKVFGAINLTREIYGPMCRRGKGVIINVVGLSGDRPDAYYIAGSSANAALIMFSRSLGGDSIRHGVRVVAVNPGRWRPRSTSATPSGWRRKIRRQVALARRRGGAADEARGAARGGLGHGGVPRLRPRLLYQRQRGDDRRRTAFVGLAIGVRRG